MGGGARVLARLTWSDRMLGRETEGPGRVQTKMVLHRAGEQAMTQSFSRAQALGHMCLWATENGVGDFL